MQTTKKFAVISVLTLLLISLGFTIIFIFKEKFRTPVLPSETEETDTVWSGWVPYWNASEGVEELYAYDAMPSDVVAFAGLLSLPDDRVLILDSVDSILRLLGKSLDGQTSLFISFTNDVQTEDGGYIQKDTKILWRLLGSDETIDAHISQLLQIASQYDVDGIEIDYEAIRQDTALWQRFCVFLDRLYDACQKKDLRLRVVVGWNSVDSVVLPEGPEYVVTCYNLYGSHTGPGPKADFTFLKDVFEKNEALPGEVTMAFSCGGFDWGENDACCSVTQKQVQELLSKHKKTAARDPASAALSFSYSDDAGKIHHVWYADKETLSNWVALGREYGYSRFSVWSYGSNILGDLLSLN